MRVALLRRFGLCAKAALHANLMTVLIERSTVEGLRRRLLEWRDNDPATNYAYMAACLCLVLFGGLMSGLTLGAFG